MINRVNFEKKLREKDLTWVTDKIGPVLNNVVRYFDPPAKAAPPQPSAAKSVMSAASTQSKPQVRESPEEQSLQSLKSVLKDLSTAKKPADVATQVVALRQWVKDNNEYIGTVADKVMVPSPDAKQYLGRGQEYGNPTDLALVYKALAITIESDTNGNLKEGSLINPTGPDWTNGEYTESVAEWTKHFQAKNNLTLAKDPSQSDTTDEHSLKIVISNNQEGPHNLIQDSVVGPVTFSSLKAKAGLSEEPVEARSKTLTSLTNAEVIRQGIDPKNQGDFTQTLENLNLTISQDSGSSKSPGISQSSTDTQPTNEDQDFIAAKENPEAKNASVTDLSDLWPVYLDNLKKAGYANMDQKVQDAAEMVGIIEKTKQDAVAVTYTLRFIGKSSNVDRHNKEAKDGIDLFVQSIETYNSTNPTRRIKVIENKPIRYNTDATTGKTIYRLKIKVRASES